MGRSERIASHPEVLLTEEVRDALVLLAEEAQPYETGGLLLGTYTNGQPWITKAVQIVSSHTERSVVIPGESARRVVQDIQRRGNRIGYLGDWHSHPANATASQRDFESLREVASEMPADLPGPVLILLRKRGSAFHLDTFQLTGSEEMEARLILTGSPPVPA